MRMLWRDWLLVDKVFILLLMLINAVFLLRYGVIGLTPLLVHTAMLAGFLIYRIWLVPKCLASTEHQPFHQLIVLSWLICLYSTLNVSTFAAMPWNAEAILAGWDRALFGGVSPTHLLQAYTTPLLTNILAVAYAYFIPYLYLSIALGIFCRPVQERNDLVDGLTLLYSISFLGYLFMPAGGPARFYEGQFQLELTGGAIYRMVVNTSYAGGLHGAFPSLHVGASLFICLFDLKRNRLRGLMYIPVVAGIAAATLVLRWHYVVDVLAAVILVSILTRYINRRQPAALLPRLATPLPYRLVRGFWRLVTCSLYFRRVETEGHTNLPRSGPVLICANHRNSLVDALALMTTMERPITLTAKVTLGRNPLLALLLKWHGVVTFHRRQDGGDDNNPRRNPESLQKCLDKLLAGEVVCLFPEGVSHSDNAMHEFRTGAARLALAYEQARTERGLPPLTLIPVGLNYDDKSRFRSNLLVIFGQPLHQSQLQLSPKELTLMLYDAVNNCAINFRSRREAQAMPVLARLVVEGTQAPPMLGYPSLPLVRYYACARQIISQPLPLSLFRQVVLLRGELRRYKVTPDNLFIPLHRGKATLFAVREAELLLLAMPAALWGMLLHALPLILLRLITKKLSQDEDHWASNFLIPSFFVLPIYYAMVSLLALIWLGPVGVMALLVSMIYGAMVALRYYDRMAIAKARLHAYLLFRTHPGLQQLLAERACKLLKQFPALTQTGVAI